jgi:hypothetical protein
MILISHRGNINSILPHRENSTKYIDEAIALGYNVEIDVRLIGGKLFLGHDSPDFNISLSWLLYRSKSLFVHTKNFEALSFLIDKDLMVFYHQTEHHTIINKCNLIWSHNLSEANEKSIIPLLSLDDIIKFKEKKVAGICSDFIANFGEK